LGIHVVMPNHIHGIIIIHPTVGASHWDAPTENGPKRGSIGAMIGAYKMSVTRRIQREMNETAIWQRNDYEHLIRNDEEHNRVHLYIEANVDNWGTDQENPRRGNSKCRAAV
jgi:REP element-mobilizing transposase RayT